MLAWITCNDLFTRQRATLTRSVYGEAVNTWTEFPEQIIQGTMQPYVSRTARGVQLLEAEGEVQRLTYRLFCNYVNRDVPEPQATDVIFLDRIIDADGNKYRVLSAEDDGGRGDHLLIELMALSPSGD